MNHVDRFWSSREKDKHTKYMAAYLLSHGLRTLFAVLFVSIEHGICEVYDTVQVNTDPHLFELTEANQLDWNFTASLLQSGSQTQSEIFIKSSHVGFDK